MKNTYWSSMLGATVLSLAAAHSFAQETEEPQRAGPVRDPLDPSGLRPSARQLGAARDQVTSGTAFNPAISVLIDGFYYTDDVHGEAFELLEEIDGFTAGHGHDDEHGHGALERGFNLREVEIAFSATVDPYFDAFVMMVFEDGEIELEEAFVTTRALPAGLQVKLGRFLSDIGYINRQHPHMWSFVDRPLMSELLFGEHGLQEKGVQLSWLPRTPFYTRVGIEALQGENEAVANYIGEVEDVEDTARGLSERAGPRVYTSFAKLSPNLPFQHALQIGLFYGRSLTHQFTEEHSTRFEDRDGTTDFWGTDFVYKYDAGRLLGHGNWSLQAEYARRKRDLDRQDTYFACQPAGVDCDDPDNLFQPGDVANMQSFRERQDGLYVQGVYGIAPRWTAGLRYERVGMENSTGRNGGAEWDASDRWSLMTTWMPTEFSRLRIQFTRSDFAIDDARERFNQVYVQWQMSLGVHGAHTF